jgi:hypothetical protein
VELNRRTALGLKSGRRKTEEKSKTQEQRRRAMLSWNEQETAHKIGTALRSLKYAKTALLLVEVSGYDKGTQSSVQALSVDCMELARALADEANEIEERDDYAGDFRSAMQFLTDAARFAKTQNEEQCRAAVAHFDCALQVAGQAIALRCNRQAMRD